MAEGGMCWAGRVCWFWLLWFGDDGGIYFRGENRGKRADPLTHPRQGFAPEGKSRRVWVRVWVSLEKGHRVWVSGIYPIPESKYSGIGYWVWVFVLATMVLIPTNFSEIVGYLEKNFGDSFRQRSKGGFLNLELEIKSFRNRGSSPDLKKYWIFYVQNLTTLV